MAQDSSELEKLTQLIDGTSLPTTGEGVELLAVAHNEFQARWALSPEAIEKGREMASHAEDGAHLVLRAFSLPPESHSQAVSGIWHDFNIEGTDNSGYFTLPGPADAINASIGLVNRDGRFSPLVRGESITLPAAAPAERPAAPEPTPEVDVEEAKEEPTEEAKAFERPVSYEALNEEEICARLANIEGLPEAFKAPASEALKEPEDGQDFEVLFSESSPKLESTGSLDESAIHDTVRAKLAGEPQPEIQESTEEGSEQTSEALEEFHAGASEQLASQWEELWTEQAPVEIRACFALSGKIAPGMKLLLGHEAIEPAPGGFFSWKQEINSFGQVWPMLQAALETPAVPAAPALEFFKDVQPAQRMLELHGSLEIEGHVSDPDYIDRLPEALQVGATGDFKLSRMLPSGAVILPSLSLIAG